jgi:hypothetical protein
VDYVITLGNGRLTNAASFVHDKTTTALTDTRLAHSISGTFITRGIYKDKIKTSIPTYQQTSKDMDLLSKRKIRN